MPGDPLFYSALNPRSFTPPLDPREKSENRKYLMRRIRILTIFHSIRFLQHLDLTQTHADRKVIQRCLGNIASYTSDLLDGSPEETKQITWLLDFLLLHEPFLKNKQVSKFTEARKSYAHFPVRKPKNLGLNHFTEAGFQRRAERDVAAKACDFLEKEVNRPGTLTNEIGYQATNKKLKLLLAFTEGVAGSPDTSIREAAFLITLVQRLCQLEHILSENDKARLHQVTSKTSDIAVTAGLTQLLIGDRREAIKTLTAEREDSMIAAYQKAVVEVFTSVRFELSLPVERRFASSRELGHCLLVCLKHHDILRPNLFTEITDLLSQIRETPESRTAVPAALPSDVRLGSTVDSNTLQTGL